MLPISLTTQESILRKLKATQPIFIKCVIDIYEAVEGWKVAESRSACPILYANAMLRWLYEGPSTRPISFGSIGPCLMKVFCILYI